MSERYFKNNFLDYHDPIKNLLKSMNRNHFRKRALEVKEICLLNFTLTHDNCDGGLYVGLAGLSYALWYMSTKKVFQEEREQLLKEAKSLLDYHLAFLETGQEDKKKDSDKEAFLLGRTGLYLTGALISSEMDDKDSADKYIEQYAECSSTVSQKDYFDELFVGRAGYLCGVLNLQMKLAHKVLEEKNVRQILRMLLESGLSYAKRHKSTSLLMYSYYDVEYLGAAHGLSSILQMFLSYPEILKASHDMLYAVKKSVDWLVGIQKANGSTVGSTDELFINVKGEDGELVHWCHGAPGMIYMYTRAYLYWKDEKYLQAALMCGNLVWNKGLLMKGPGICHGISGNAYLFLILYRLTKDQRHLYRALKFAEFLEGDEFKDQARVPDSPYSLFEGWAGVMCLYVDLADDPLNAEFPLFPVFF